MRKTIGVLTVAGAAALLGGCAAYDTGYYGGYGYGYNGYGPTYYESPGYYSGPSVGVGVTYVDRDRYYGRHYYDRDRYYYNNDNWRGERRDHGERDWRDRAQGN